MEKQYLMLMKKVLQRGDWRNSRNSRVLSVFGEKLEGDISQNFPLMTSKKVHFDSIFFELQWFLRGETNNRLLQKNNVKIWEGNTSKEFLERSGLDYEEGIGGPIYGWQWRNFGKEYYYKKEGSMRVVPGGKEGVDQVKDVQDLLKNDPTSRRIIINAWNPAQLKFMCLPPCHVLYQFYVNKKSLSCQMYQRSSDLFLGLPFNIASSALLTYLLARSCDLHPGSLSVVLGDAHIYEEHLSAAEKQIARTPRAPPTLELVKARNNVWEYERSDVVLRDYTPHPRIKTKMIP